MSTYSDIQFCNRSGDQPTIRTRIDVDYVAVQVIEQASAGAAGEARVTLNLSAEGYRELAKACEEAAEAVNTQRTAA